MSDGDDSSERDHGGFVFENDRAADNDDGANEGEELDTRRIAAVLLLSLAIIVLAVVVVQPLVTGVATNLFGADSPSESGNVTNATTAGEPSGSADTAVGTTGDSQTSAATTATVTSGQSPTSVTSVTTPIEEATTASATATKADQNTTASENATATQSGGSPVIDDFTVTDRSAGGNATFDVAWNVSDSNADLATIEVTIVADPDGEARTVASRRFDAGGASTVDSGTFEVEGGSGDVYEVRMEVIDAAGNSVFTLTREVADGDPDG